MHVHVLLYYHFVCVHCCTYSWLIFFFVYFLPFLLSEFILLIPFLSNSWFLTVVLSCVLLPISCQSPFVVTFCYTYTPTFWFDIYILLIPLSVFCLFFFSHFYFIFLSFLNLFSLSGDPIPVVLPLLTYTLPFLISYFISSLSFFLLHFFLLHL